MLINVKKKKCFSSDGQTHGQLKTIVRNLTKNSRTKKISKMVFTHKIDFYSKIKNYLKKTFEHILLNI